MRSTLSNFREEDTEIRDEALIRILPFWSAAIRWRIIRWHYEPESEH